MKKKTFIPLLFAGLLTMGSCNDINDMSVDFGDRTYINEYKGLINSINDLNTSLSERFNALGIILEKGLANIQVAIDKNTGEITILNQSLNDGLGTINTTLFNGFTTVAQQIDATGKTVVAAIDKNGNLLRLQIDNTGKLISAQLITSTQDLIKAMKENTSSISEKLGLIDAAIKAGFASTAQGQNDIKEAVKEAIAALAAEVKAGNKSNADALAELKAAVTAQTTSLETKLAAIEQANKEGLATLAEKNDLINAAIAALNESVKSQTVSIEKKLADIETATKNGLATLAQKNDLIDASIKALAAEVKAGNKSNEEALKEIKAAIASQTTSLETKLAAIEQANKEGLATLAQKNDLTKGAIDALAAEVKAGNKSNEDALKEIKAAVTAQTSSLETKLAAIETANKNGLLTLSQKQDLIKDAINSIKTSVDASNQSLSSVVSALQQINTVLGKMSTADDDRANLEELKKELEKITYSNGVTVPSGTTDKNNPNYNPALDPTYNVYVHPDKFTSIENAYNLEKKSDGTLPTNASEDAKLYYTLTQNLTVYNAAIKPAQQVSPNSFHDHATFEEVSHNDPIIISSETVLEGDKYVRVIKAAGDIIYHAKVHYNGCAYPKIYSVEVCDAESVLKYELGQLSGISVHGYKGGSQMLPFRVDWSNSNGTGERDWTGNIRLQTYYKDTTTGKVKIVDEIYFHAKCY